MTDFPIPLADVLKIADQAAWWMFSKTKGKLAFADLKQEAMLGLIGAVRTWNPIKSSFKTYGSTRARFHLMDYLRRQDHLTRVHRKKSKGHLPNVFSFHALNEVVTDRLQVMVDETVAVPGKSTLESDYAESLILMVSNYRLRDILYLHYFRGLTFKAIGKIMGITESRISQLHRAAIETIRRKAG
ncbi:MAG: sigma-70 family RNA polymerase sigma factor [Planctomycetia bacterium]|nr:sigma-70 family RNA polymerase sigma factor [Planctomycetia bacterium]